MEEVHDILSQMGASFQHVVREANAQEGVFRSISFDV